MEKIKYITLLFLILNTSVFAQNREIRQAEKAIEEQDFTKAKSLLQEAESYVSSLNDKYKARYYMAHGQAVGLTSQGDLEEIEKAANSFKKAIEYGNEEEGAMGLNKISEFLVESAIQDQQSQDFKNAYQKLYKAYEMSPTDTIYLFAAAGNAYNAQDDDKAIEYYSMLRDINYRGDEITYTAVHDETGEIQPFGSKEERDAMVELGEFSDPQAQRAERRDYDVIKQLALTYLRKGDEEKAIKTIHEAREMQPDDMELLKAEAMIYEESGDSEEYLKILDELIKKDPDNAATYYIILGDNALNAKEEEKARGYYEKAIEENPDSPAAYNGVANSYLNQQEAIVKEMNSLGMSKADTKKYNKLSEERNDLLRDALPYLEKAQENAPESLELIQALYQINTQLNNTEEAAKYKKMMDNAR